MQEEPLQVKGMALTLRPSMNKMKKMKLINIMFLIFKNYD